MYVNCTELGRFLRIWRIWRNAESISYRQIILNVGSNPTLSASLRRSFRGQANLSKSEVSERDVRSRYTKDLMSWACPRCDRTFRQVNQRHACGVGNAATLLKNRPPALTDLYRKLETTVRGFGDVEVVTRNRYALFRTTRIFADLTVMRDALRVVVHLGRKARAPYFIKIAQGDKRISHVALVRTAEDLRTIIPFLREAFDLAQLEDRGSSRKGLSQGSRVLTKR